jgi:AAA domain, putative AbiEii toxin, Type IV TA system/AAA ATPase domain
MIRSVKIAGYRAFRKFSMEGLRRVNLLVGKNNTGKSSALEALFLLSNAGSPATIWQLLMRRGEIFNEQPPPGRAFQPESEIRHLFYGHEIKIGSTLSIATYNGSPNRELTFQIGEVSSDPNFALFSQLTATDRGIAPQFGLIVKGNPAPISQAIPLTARGNLRQDVMQTVLNVSIGRHVGNPAIGAAGDNSASRYVTAESLTIPEVQAEYSEIALTPREEPVMRALKFVQPDIERLAISQGTFFHGAGWPVRGGLKVKLKDLDEPVPIGSLGEGIWRMLAMAISLSKAQSGVFLIDEIDTGLHFSVMEKMWRFVADAARELEIQVFATTHSLDCVRSLAALCSEDPGIAEDVSIQRIETDTEVSTTYTPSEILALARAATTQVEIEVR